MQEIIDHLLKFDKERNWNDYEKVKTREEKIDLLYKQIVHTIGELGEFANLVKKCKRDNEWHIEQLKEEITDTFIFLLKISMTLDMDLKEEFFKKMKLNEERFKHFKINE
ncbi:MAG: hypothetical protein AABW46_00775 [Nanoarchaeota archaeon]